MWDFREELCRESFDCVLGRRKIRLFRAGCSAHTRAEPRPHSGRFIVRSKVVILVARCHMVLTKMAPVSVTLSKQLSKRTMPRLTQRRNGTSCAVPIAMAPLSTLLPINTTILDCTCGHKGCSCFCMFDTKLMNKKTFFGLSCCSIMFTPS